MKKEVSVRAAATLPVEYAEKNSIARGVWACSPSTYKIISLACSLLSNGKTQDGYWVEFSMPGLIKALGIKDGTATRALYDKSIKDAFGSCIEYEITGKDGGKLAGLADVEIRVPHFGFADRIQEVHIKVIHILIHAIEVKLEA